MKVDSRIHSRGAGIVDPVLLREFAVHIVGVGAIGSTACRVLSQLGFTRFYLYDGDTVQPENLGVQFYRQVDVGRPKVEACRDVMASFLPHLDFEVHASHYAGEDLDGIVVVGVDSMQARARVWKSLQARSAGKVSLYVDGRTAGEEVHVYAIRPSHPDDIMFYEESIVPDEKTTHMPCGQQGAPHAQAVIAGIMGTQIVRWFRSEVFHSLVCMNLRMMHVTCVSSTKE